MININTRKFYLYKYHLLYLSQYEEFERHLKMYCVSIMVQGMCLSPLIAQRNRKYQRWITYQNVCKKCRREEKLRDVSNREHRGALDISVIKESYLIFVGKSIRKYLEPMWVGRPAFYRQSKSFDPNGIEHVCFKKFYFLYCALSITSADSFSIPTETNRPFAEYGPTPFTRPFQFILASLATNMNHTGPLNEFLFIVFTAFDSKIRKLEVVISTIKSNACRS